MKSSSTSVLTAFTVALGALCSAGAPCCGGGGASGDFRPVGRVSLAALDGGVDAAFQSNNTVTDAGCSLCREAFPRNEVRCRYSPDLPDDPEAISGPSIECLAPYDVCAEGAGRRPAGFVDEPSRGRTELGAYLASTALLEAVSVDAFLVLSRELEQFEAPSSLVARARRAAADEVRHARMMKRLATAKGGEVRRTPPLVPRRARTKVAVAVENAVEGCVRETFGALLATFQAAHASDAELRQAMIAIARDETDHAILAFDVHRWMMATLPPGERQRVRRAALRARRALRVPPANAAVGLPPPGVALHLARALHDALPI